MAGAEPLADATRSCRAGGHRDALSCYSAQDDHDENLILFQAAATAKTVGYAIYSISQQNPIRQCSRKQAACPVTLSAYSLSNALRFWE